MIIHACSKKSPLMFGRLLDYLRREQGHDPLPPRGINLMSLPEDRDDVLREFAGNYYAHSARRRGGVVLWHEVIAPHPQDALRVTEDMLYDLAGQYVAERAPRALAYMQVHLESDAEYRPHVHLMISGNEIGSEKQVSLRKPDYHRIRLRMREYAEERYPELLQAYEPSRDRRRRREVSRVQERGRLNEVKREGGRSKQETGTRVTDAVRSALLAAAGQRDFEARLLEQGLDYYELGGKKTPGVRDVETGKCYRVRTLGLEKDLAAKREEWERAMPLAEEDRQADDELLRLLDRLEEERGREDDELER
jgi:hypothetical protein